MTDPTPPSTQPAAPPPPLIPIGAHVTSRHAPEWGKGVVMSRDGKLVRVLFFSHPAKKPVAVPAASLVVGHVASWPDPNKIPASSSTTKAKPKKKIAPAKHSRSEALDLFKKEFPDTFKDEKFLKEEREYKWAAHELFQKLLGKEELARLVEAGDAAELAERAKQVEAASVNLLHPIEKARYLSGFKDAEKTVAFFKALGALLDSDDPEMVFADYVRAADALPSKSGRAAIWTITTLLPFLAKPDTFFFVKPTPTKEAAARYSLDLMYKAQPNVDTFKQLVKLAKLLREDLDPLGCRDLIDVQSYVWRTQ